MTISSSAHGALAEQLAIVELLRRGHRVAVPVVDDDGVDLVVNYHLRVQVKNAMRKTQNLGPGGTYPYEGFKWSSQYAWSEADIFILHGEEAAGSRWFIVPAFAITGHGKTLSMYDAPSAHAASAARTVALHEDRWDHFDVPPSTQERMFRQRA